MANNDDVALLAPLQIDATTGEPYLRLPAPYTHLVLTPQRPSDVARVVQHFNDPRVYEGLVSPRHPYLEEHGRAWQAHVGPLQRNALADLRAGKRFVGVVPVSTIRDTTGTTIADAKIIGDCFVSRNVVKDLNDPETAKRLSEENAAKEVGDPTIVWTIGNWLDPAYHGQGIMSVVVHALIYDWAVPKMNARHIVADAFVGNLGSIRVFEKNGFTRLEDAKDAVRLHESRGARLMSLHRVEWRLPA